MTPQELKSFLTKNKLSQAGFVRIVFKDKPEQLRAKESLVSQWVSGKSPIPSYMDYIIENWRNKNEGSNNIRR